MNPNDSKQTQFGLVRDMLETAAVFAKFDTDQARDTAAKIKSVGRLMLTGEGSSRIFPAKNSMTIAMKNRWPIVLATEAGRQAQEYQLKDWAVFAASNSGKTSEVIKLFNNLRAQGHQSLFGLTASPTSKLEELTTKCYVLGCGEEHAVAATKSVLEQGLFYQAMFEHLAGAPTLKAKLKDLAGAMTEAMTVKIDPAIVDKVAKAGTIYFAGRNDGVAEELTLKTNEITRKKSDFLEGTYAVHGIEEVMNPDDVVIWVDPYEDSHQKFTDVLCKGVGMTVVAIATQSTPFPTIRVPKIDPQGYVSMCAGWNLLVEVGVKLGINLDKPTRARKVGNEFVG